MSGACCGNDSQFDGATPGFRRTLWAVIFINAFMFLVEMPMGFVGGSESLKADSLDFLGDTATYTISLMVIGHSLLWRARAALLKGISLSLMGLWVLGSAIYHVFYLGEPSAMIMGSVAVAAFTANMVSVLLLYRYKDGDSNVRSVWLCSRNDAVGNVAVMVAASGVWLSGTAWPDLIVATVMASLFLSSAFQIYRQASAEMELARRSDSGHDHHHHRHEEASAE